MRSPTPPEVALRWWTDALAGREPMVTHEPQCGYFKRRLAKDGPFVPCRIYIISPVDPDTGELIADEKLACMVNGRAADALNQWLWLASHPIPKSEYDFMGATRQWALKHSPDDPVANPNQPVNWITTPLPF